MDQRPTAQQSQPGYYPNMAYYSQVAPAANRDPNQASARPTYTRVATKTTSLFDNANDTLGFFWKNKY